jgi:hypothetical protein
VPWSERSHDNVTIFEGVALVLGGVLVLVLVRSRSLGDSS